MFSNTKTKYGPLGALTPEDCERLYPPPPPRRIGPGLRLLAAGAGVCALLAGAFALSQIGGTDPDSASRVAPPPRLDHTPGGDLQADSPRFRALLRQTNDADADAAARRGETFLPTPEATLAPIDKDDAQAPQDANAQIDRAIGAAQSPAAAADPAPPRPPKPPVASLPPLPSTDPDFQRRVAETAAAHWNAPPEPEAAEAAADPWVAAMVAQMQAVSSALSTPATMRVDSEAPPEEAPGGSGTARPGRAQPAMLVAAGEVLHARTLTAATSDLPGPVLAEVSGGPLAGSRLIGVFAAHGPTERMRVEFVSMTLPDGRSLAIRAVAVDARSAETSVASGVRRRLLSRYAPIFISSFIGGYADAASRPRQRIAPNGESGVVAEPSTARQSLHAGLAAAGRAVGNDLVDRAPSGPEILLHAGWPMSVLFLDPVADGGGAQHPAIGR